MDAITSRSLWTEVEPEEGDLHRHWSYAGLEVHDVGGDEEEFFTVSLRSYPSLLLLPTNAERAFEIATALAELRDWICVADWDRKTPMLEQIEVAIRFAGEVEIPQPPYLGPFDDEEPPDESWH